MFLSRFKFVLGVLGCLFLTQGAFAQQRKIDSLVVLIKKAKEDTNKVNLLNTISGFSRSNLTEQKKYSDEAMALAKKLNFLKGEYNACGNFFQYYRSLSNFTKCIEYTEQRLKIAKTLKDVGMESSAWNGFGVVYGSGLNRYDRAIIYYKKALNIRLENGQYNNLETLYNNIANAYNRMQKHLDSALYYIDKAVEMSIKDPAKVQTLSVAYSTKGEIYTTLKDWDKATSYLKQSQAIKNQLNDYTSHTYLLNYLAYIQEEKGQLDSAWINYQESLQIFEKYKIKTDITKTYKGLAQLSEKRKQPAEALKYYKLMMEANDAATKGNSDKMNVLEREQQAAEIALLAKDKKIQQERIKQANFTTILVGIGGFILLGFLVWIYRQGTIRQKIGKQLEKTYVDVQEKSKELQSLNGALSSTVTELNITIETVDQQKQLVQLANQRMHDSIKYGKKIQEAILPTDTEFLQAFSEYFSLYMPRDTVSGDFYWYYKLNQTTQYVAVVDCTGHGVPGAFMSMIGYSLLNQIISETHITEPAEILHYLDLGIIQGLRQTNNHNADGMDVCLCKIEKLTNTEFMVEFSGAKRPLYYTENQIIQLLRPSRESIGGMTGIEKTFPSQKIKLYKGDVLYLTSDGFADNPNKHRKRFGEDRFAKLLQAISSHALSDQKDLIKSAYQTHQEGTVQRDDITVVGVRL